MKTFVVTLLYRQGDDSESGGLRHFVRLFEAEESDAKAVGNEILEQFRADGVARREFVSFITLGTFVTSELVRR